MAPTAKYTAIFDFKLKSHKLEHERKLDKFMGFFSAGKDVKLFDLVNKPSMPEWFLALLKLEMIQNRSTPLERKLRVNIKKKIGLKTEQLFKGKCLKKWLSPCKLRLVYGHFESGVISEGVNCKSIFRAPCKVSEWSAVHVIKNS